MSIQEIDKVLRQLRLKGARFQLMTHLANCADNRGARVFPGLPRLIALTGLSERYIQLLLAEFVKCGWLEIVRRGGGPGKRTIFRLHLSDPQPTLTFAVSEISDHPAAAPDVENPVDNTSFPQGVHHARSVIPRSGIGDLGITDLFDFPQPNSKSPQGVRSTGTSADPSSTTPSSTTKELPALIAPALSQHVETAYDDPVGGLVPTAVRDHEGPPTPGADDRRGRMEGPHQGPSPSARVPDADERAGVAGDRRGGACAPTVAPPAADPRLEVRAQLATLRAKLRIDEPAEPVTRPRYHLRRRSR